MYLWTLQIFWGWFLFDADQSLFQKGDGTRSPRDRASIDSKETKKFKRSIKPKKLVDSSRMDLKEKCQGNAWFKEAQERESNKTSTDKI